MMGETVHKRVLTRGTLYGRNEQDVSDGRNPARLHPRLNLNINGLELRGIPVLSDAFSGHILGNRARCVLTRVEKWRRNRKRRYVIMAAAP